ncbi:MAG: isochorismatase family protein [Myxococcaceae bacterium]
MKYEPGTALIVVDVQNDFVDPRGSLHVRGAEEVLDAVNREIHAARAAGVPIFYTQDWHPERTPHFNTDGGIWPPHCIHDTWGAQFHPKLHLHGPAYFLKKGVGGEDGYSAFTVRDPETDEHTSTGLVDRLRELGIRHIAVVGYATDYCVHDTAKDAIRHGFEITAIADAMKPVDLKPDDGERALEEISARGAHVERAEAAA